MSHRSWPWRPFLKIDGYVAMGVASAQEGLRLLESEGWDLVITDRAMPEMDGEEFADLIRQRTPKMPIIMITGFPGGVTRLECVDLVLRKPFAPSELLTHVARVLAK